MLFNATMKISKFDMSIAITIIRRLFRLTICNNISTLIYENKKMKYAKKIRIRFRCQQINCQSSYRKL